MEAETLDDTLVDKLAEVEGETLADTLGDLEIDALVNNFTCSSEPPEGPAACRAKEVPSFLSHFKTVSVGPVQGIEPTTIRSTD